MPKEIKNTTSPQCVKNAVITGAYKDFTLKSMCDFILMLRNRTTSELIRDFPRNFTKPDTNSLVNQSEMVKNMLAIDAIQWKLTGDYMKFLKTKNVEDLFEGETALFKGLKIVEKYKWGFKLEMSFEDFKERVDVMHEDTIEDLLTYSVNFDWELTDLAIKRIFG